MKTAQEWHDELLAMMNRPPAFCFCSASVSDIQDIQADALKWASEQAWPHDACGKILAEAERLDKHNEPTPLH